MRLFRSARQQKGWRTPRSPHFGKVRRWAQFPAVEAEDPLTPPRLAAAFLTLASRSCTLRAFLLESVNCLPVCEGFIKAASEPEHRDWVPCSRDSSMRATHSVTLDISVAMHRKLAS
jgi:hypothetical protein